MRPHPQRLANLQAAMRAEGAHLLALTPGASWRYLLGRAPPTSDRLALALIPQAGAPGFILPALHGAESRFVYRDGQRARAALHAALESLDARGKTIGVEASRLPYAIAALLRDSAPTAQLRDFSEGLAGLRIIKDAEEIAAIRCAIAISEAALRDTLAQVRIGISERELANILDSRIVAHGGEGLAFETLLHAGGNTALPHTAPLDYAIAHGDALLIDFGARVDGYCADITRTCFVGAVTPAQRDFYAVVAAANAAARAAAKPGVTAESVDIAARAVIIQAGYGPLLRHRTGHGIGLLAHEAPYITRGNKQTLEPGMVFTVEPGIYRIGDIGVRIEDNILITESGAESLTTFPRELRVIAADPPRSPH